MGLFQDLHPRKDDLRHLAGVGGTLGPTEDRSFVVGTVEAEIDRLLEMDESRIEHRGFTGFLSREATMERKARLRMEFWDSVDPFQTPDLTKCRLSPETLLRMAEKEKLLKAALERKKISHKNRSKGQKKRRTKEKANARRRDARQGRYGVWWALVRKLGHAKVENRLTKEVFYTWLSTLPDSPSGEPWWKVKGANVHFDRPEGPMCSTEGLYFVFNGEVVT